MRYLVVPILLAASLLFLQRDAAAMAKRSPLQWSYFHFDGTGFVAGRPETGAFLAVREGVRPVVAADGWNMEAAELAAGHGAVAGICYLQSSGGKLRARAGFHPVPGVQVAISDGDRVIATAKTDDNGFFVAALPAGSYRLSAGAAVEVKVSAGQTALIPLRVGKRMVD